MRHTLYISALALLLLTSCEETIPLDIEQTPQKVVIEGMVSNLEGQQFVKVFRSVDFYAPTGSTPISNATVSVSDDMGNEFNFLESAEKGVYLPSATFVGEVGHTYHLTVIVDNVTYEADDRMFSVTKIDSVNYRISEEERQDPNEPGKFYEAIIFTKEPQETKDYYLFKFYRNDTLTVFSDTDIYYSDDTILGESIDGLPSPVYYGKSDTARFEMMSLSREGYLFYNDLSFLINSDGGMFSPPPANPRTNLSNDALGFFQASAIDTATLVIE